MIEIITDNIPAIITAIATIGIVRNYMRKLLVLNKEVMELQSVIVKALADDKITKEELAAIKKEAADIPGAIKSVIDPIRKIISNILRRKK